MCRVVVVGMGREAEQSVNRRGVVHCSELYGKGRRAIVEVRASRIQRAACLPFPTSHLKFHPFLFISPSLSTPLHLPTSHQHNLQNGRQRRPGTLNLCGSSSVRRDRFFSTPRRDNEALRAHSRLSLLNNADQLRPIARAAHLREHRCRCLHHLPHAVLCPEKERPRRYQGPPLQDRRHVDLQDRQARSRQGPLGRHRHLHRQEARGSVSLHPQHGCPQRLPSRVPAREFSSIAVTSKTPHTDPCLARRH